VHSKETSAYDEADEVHMTSSGDVISGIDDLTIDQSAVMTSSLLLLHPEDVDLDVSTDGQTSTCSSPSVS